mgnify:CR=1 FL=1
MTGEESLDEIVRVLDGANIIVHDAGGVIRRWTAGCEALYGWLREEAIGRVVHDLLETTFPVPLDDIRRQVQCDGAWEGELTHRHKGGQPVWVASRWIAARRPSTQAGLVVQTNNDISELRRAQSALAAREALLRSILSTVPDALVVIDAKGIVTSFSAAAEQLFGYRADEVCGRNVSMLMPSPDREAHDGYLDRYRTTGERRIIGVGRVVNGRRKDGSTFPLELSVGEAAGADGPVFTGFLRDLTSRHRMEEELRQAQKMEAVGQLTGGIAHDFNNLLTVISGNLEMLEGRLRDPAQRELLREAQEAADEGAKLTGQLLAFGRRQALNPKLADVGQLVSSFLGLLRRTLGETVELRTVVTGSSHTALVDASQLQNALLNLALNARDAMPGGGRLTVEVSDTYLDRDYAQMYGEVRVGRYVMVTVTDTGAGMSPEVRQRAFEPFFTTKGVGAGTGLGLSMVYGFAKQSGGHVQIYSEPGQGTSVRLYLPVASEQPETTPAPGGGERRLPRGEETVLVVEDDPRVRRVAVARLRDLGYAVLEAPAARQALEIVSSHPEIRLLFTDIVMPGGMTGVELAQEVAVSRPDIKLLFTSGYADPQTGQKALPAGAPWLRKPYTARDLAVRLRELLD